MDIKLKRDWFYPVDAKPANDRRMISGGRFRKGINRDVDPALRPFLPKGAVVLDENIVEEVVEVVEELTIQDMDSERSWSDGEAEAAAEAEVARKAAIKAKRVAAMAKAREAKKAKKDAK